MYLNVCYEEHYHVAARQFQWRISFLNHEISVFDVIIHIHSRSGADCIQEGFQAASLTLCQADFRDNY